MNRKNTTEDDHVAGRSILTGAQLVGIGRLLERIGYFRFHRPRPKKKRGIFVNLTCYGCGRSYPHTFWERRKPIGQLGVVFESRGKGALCKRGTVQTLDEFKKLGGKGWETYKKSLLQTIAEWRERGLLTEDEIQRAKRCAAT